MHIRPMQSGDVAAASSILCGAFADDELYSYLWPHMHEHPEAIWRHVVKGLHKRILEPGVYALVCVAPRSEVASWPARTAPAPQESAPAAPTPAPVAGSHSPRDSSADEIVLGVCLWNWAGGPDSKGAWHSKNTGLLTRAHFLLARAQTWHEFFFRLNPSVSIPNTVAWNKFLASPSSNQFANLGPHWLLGLLATAPAYQGRGAGRLMMEWGFDRAREEGVPAVLHASRVGTHAYGRYGFRAVGPGGFVRTDDTKWKGWDMAGTNMIWEPESKKGTWIREAEGEETSIVVKGVRSDVEVVLHEKYRSPLYGSS